jgi:transposase
MECFLAANRHALEYFGASTRRAMHDNLKSAVLERVPGYAPVFNRRYLDFAAHYGFKPVACNVGRGNEKGRVANSILNQPRPISVFGLWDSIGTTLSNSSPLDR